MVWYIRDAEVRELVTTEEANQVMEDVFRNEANNDIVTKPTVKLSLPKGGNLMVKVGADFANDVFGYKAYPAGPPSAIGRFLIILYSMDTGLDAIVEGRYITELRTGAVGAVGTKFLARPEASTLGIIGTGREARRQLASTLLVRDFEKIWCYSRGEEGRQTFAKEMSELHGVEVIPVASGEECVREADVVTTITASNEPVLMGSWLREGTHINAVGATSKDRRELDEEAVARCGTIAVELKEGAIEEVGELIYAVERGRLSWDDVHELKEVVSGTVSRKSPEEITLSDTVGVGAEDVAMAWFAVQKARKLNVGRELDFEGHYNIRNVVPPTPSV